MAIEKKEIKDLTSTVRSLYQKASGLLETGNLDYGIELMKGIIQRNPGFMEGRKKLREAEAQRSSNLGGIAKFFSGLKSSKYMIAAKKEHMSKKPLEAMSALEEALAINLYQPAALNLLAEVAYSEGALDIAIESLEVIVSTDPKNEANLNKLCGYYKEAGDGNNVLAICQKLADLHPESLELQAKVREAAALATMSDSAWRNQGNATFRDRMKEEKGNDRAQGDKIIRAEADIRAEIARLEEAMAAGGPEAESVDAHRKLAEYQMQVNEYEKAIDTYEWIANKLGTLDPAIDKAIEKANVAIGNQNVEHLRANGGSEEDIQAQIQAIYDYRLDRYEERVRLYPNDLMLRYELAELYWEGQRVDDALEQFQLAQRQPQKRLFAIVYLGRCFHAKGQYDMAVEQFRKALQDMLTNDTLKMDTLYYLGLTYDAMGSANDALDCFKQIYSVDITYRDVRERVTANYK